MGSTIPYGGSGGTGGTAPGGISFGGSPAYMPDWASLISHDPGLLQAQAALNATGVGDAAQRNAGIQRAYAGFGDTSPDLSALAKSLGLSAADAQNIIDPATIGLAKQNTAAGTSTLARLAQADEDARRGITNNLSARGLLNSGEAGFQQGREQQQYVRNQYDARQSLLDSISGLQQNFLNAQLQRAQALAQAYSDAANRQFANNQGSPGDPGTQAHYVGTDSGGVPVYQDDQGNAYFQNGSPYTPYGQRTARQLSVPITSGYTPPPVRRPTAGVTSGGNRIS